MRHLIITAIVMLVITIILQIDDDLSDQTLQWVTELKDDKNSDAYQYLLGISAPENKNPLELGKQIYQQIKSAENRFFNGDSFNYQEVQTEKLKLPEGEWYCNLNEIDCFDTIMSSIDNLEQELSEHTVLLKRLETFFSYNDFHVQTNPLLDSPIPPYQYLSRAHRLHLLHLTKQTMEDGEKLIEFEHHVLSLQAYQVAANTLIAKMIFSKYISDTIDILWYLKQKQQLNPVFSIEKYNPVNIGMDNAIKHEFGFVYNLYQNIENHKELLEGTEKLPGWSIRLLFKPNMTSNLAQQRYQQVIDNMNLPVEDFAELMQEPPASRSKVSIRNPIGLLLLNIAEPNFNTYIARIHNLNKKIVLYETIQVSQDGAISHEEKSNIEINDKMLCEKTFYSMNMQYESCLHIH